MQELFGLWTFGTSMPSVPSWCKGTQSNAPEHLRVLSTILQLMQPCAAGRPGMWGAVGCALLANLFCVVDCVCV